MGLLKGTFPSLMIEDLSSYVSIEDLPQNTTGVVLLVQFLGGSDDMVNIASEGNQGWKETGSVVLHYFIPTGFDFHPHLKEMERVRLALRGMRLKDDVVIESVSPFTDQISSAGRVDGGWHGWVSFIYFNRHICG